jgi:hypothetical protein
VTGSIRRKRNVPFAFSFQINIWVYCNMAGIVTTAGSNSCRFIAWAGSGLGTENNPKVASKAATPRNEQTMGNTSLSSRFTRMPRIFNPRAEATLSSNDRTVHLL